MNLESIINLIDKREKEIAEDSQLPPDKQKKPKPSRLNKAQKDTLKDLAQEFLEDYRGEEDFNKRFQLFLLAASKAL